MTNQRIGGSGNPRIRGDAMAPASAAQTARVDQAQEAQRPSFDPASIQLPPRGLGDRQSVLKGVISAGLDQLARAENWEGQENALGVLVKAMGGTPAADAGRAIESLPRDFQMLLRELRPDAAQSAQVRQDSEQLLALSVVALGTDELKGMKRGEQEAQLAADIGAIKEALTEVLRRPAGERDGLIARQRTDLAWAADVLSRGQRAFDAAGVGASARLTALVGMLDIVSRYAPAASEG